MRLFFVYSPAACLIYKLNYNANKFFTVTLNSEAITEFIIIRKIYKITNNSSEPCLFKRF